MSNFLGTCKSCDFTIFATPEDLREVEDFRGVKTGLVARVKDKGVFGRCTNGHTVFVLGEIEGTYSEKHKCDSRCLNAKGRKCRCSCGGANHGRGHAVTVTRAPSATVAATTWDDNGMMHIGQEKKTIRGLVILRSKKDVKGNKVLYSFVAANAPASLKWFCPAEEDPKWEPSWDPIPIRAFVDRHEDHPQFGKSTIITNVERIDS